MGRCRRVLVVDDEFLIVEVLSEILEDLGMEVCGSAGSADEAIALAEHHAPAIVLMDVRLKGKKDGVDAAVAIHKKVGASIIFITGSREPATVERIARHHPTAVLFKPIRLDQLRSAIAQTLGKAC